MIGNYRTVMLPTIDCILPDTFAYVRQGHRDIYASRAVFDWSFKYRHTPLPKSAVANITKPFETAVMAGGLFAITSTFFWEIGGYDEGLDTYGELIVSLWSHCVIWWKIFLLTRRRTIWDKLQNLAMRRTNAWVSVLACRSHLPISSDICKLAHQIWFRCHGTYKFIFNQCTTLTRLLNGF